jgi:hypothetical protein
MGAVFQRDGYAVEAGCICNDDKRMGDDNNRRLSVVRSVFLCSCSSGFGHIPELVRISGVVGEVSGPWWHHIHMIMSTMYLNKSLFYSTNHASCFVERCSSRSSLPVLGRLWTSALSRTGSLSHCYDVATTDQQLTDERSTAQRTLVHLRNSTLNDLKVINLQYIISKGSVKLSIYALVRPRLIETPYLYIASLECRLSSELLGQQQQCGVLPHRCKCDVSLSRLLSS